MNQVTDSSASFLQRVSYWAVEPEWTTSDLRRLRIVQHELTKRVGAYPFILGDLDEISSDRLPMFDVMFTLLAAYTDYIVGVYEKESGGEAPELGEIDDAPYFAKTHVLPRDYTWFTESNIASRTHVLDAALRIHFRDDLEEHEKQTELDALLTRAQIGRASCRERV